MHLTRFDVNESALSLRSPCHLFSYILADTHKLTLPALSPTMTEGTLVRWLVKEGQLLTTIFNCIML